MLLSIAQHTSQIIKKNVFKFMTMFHSPQPQLALVPAALSSNNTAMEQFQQQQQGSPSLSDCLWLAVPKSKISRSKKRMKTTNQKAIKTKNHIVVDGRTGELTLRHRLPFNWKDYLPQQ